MVDPETVRRHLREIDRRLQGVRQIEAAGRDGFLADPALQAQAERHLQLAIQSAIDVAIHVVAEDSPRTPESYGESFSMLASSGVIDQELADRLRLAAGLRNILVHAYLEVDPGRLWQAIESAGDLESFAAAIERYLGG